MGDCNDQLVYLHNELASVRSKNAALKETVGALQREREHLHSSGQDLQARCLQVERERDDLARQLRMSDLDRIPSYRTFEAAIGTLNHLAGTLQNEADSIRTKANALEKLQYEEAVRAKKVRQGLARHEFSAEDVAALRAVLEKAANNWDGQGWYHAMLAKAALAWAWSKDRYMDDA